MKRKFLLHSLHLAIKVILTPNDQDDKLNVFTIGNMMDKAIIHLAQGKEIDKLSLQKGVFLYLLSISARRNYDFKKVAHIAAFEPYKFGPFSELLEGEIEQLKGYNEVKSYGNKDEHEKIKSSEMAAVNYKLEKDEQEIMKNIKFLIDNLTPVELAFYVYFNPAIDESVRDYFTSNSEIKEKLRNRRQRFVKTLKNKNVIDDEVADLIIYG